MRDAVSIEGRRVERGGNVVADSSSGGVGGIIVRLISGRDGSGRRSGEGRLMAHEWSFMGERPKYKERGDRGGRGSVWVVDGEVETR